MPLFKWGLIVSIPPPILKLMFIIFAVFAATIVLFIMGINGFEAFTLITNQLKNSDTNDFKNRGHIPAFIN